MAVAEKPRLDFLTLADGTKIFYRLCRPAQRSNPEVAEPLRPMVVAIHGYTGNHTSWLPVLESLEEHGWGTLVFDLRGHGLSAKPLAWRKYSFALFTADFLEILERLNVSGAAVLGYSAGGAIALQTALRAPTRLKKLILISANHKNPFFYWRIGFLSRPAKAGVHFLSWLVGWYKRRTYNFADLRTVGGYWPSVYQGLTSMPLAVNLRCLATMGELDLGESLSAIAQPTLIIRSLHDPLVTEREAEEMVHRMPKAKLLSLDVGGHWLLTRHAGRLYAIIKEFLEEPPEFLPANRDEPRPVGKPEKIAFESKGIEGE
ncbi:alpha/beta hydrolase [Candidatus Parcubacteria bacterium]|nr:alpha/beta hydrolase [Candidatus Parcubacteria bacterium]